MPLLEYCIQVWQKRKKNEMFKTATSPQPHKELLHQFVLYIVCGKEMHMEYRNMTLHVQYEYPSYEYR